MEPAIKKKFRIVGMTCINCQEKIERHLSATKGIISFSTSFSTGKAEVIYDSDKITFNDIERIIYELDYKVIRNIDGNKFDWVRVTGLLVIIISLYYILEHLGLLTLLAPSQIADQNMGYGMLFVIGLLTSVHCVAMCGGINLSQCIPTNAGNGDNNFYSTIRPATLYNLGRVISYTAVGFMVGGLGSVIVFSNTTQGILKLIAGVFMVIMGVNMLNLFTWMRRFTPRMPRFLVNKVNVNKSKSKSPLYIGLLNGFMPCGPLQAMQIYALSTGSPISGAISMFLFSLGTVPLMFILGAGSSFLGRKFSRRIMTAGAVLVVVLGMTMLSQGMSLSGVSIVNSNTSNSSGQPSEPMAIEVVDGVQLINSTLTSRSYPEITVRSGVPVRWIIDAPESSINGCNYKFYIPEYGIEHEFVVGKNVIEFIPEKSGIFSYSCWMGMIKSRINVVESDSQLPTGSETREPGIILIEERKEPIEAGYVIPTDRVAVGIKKDGYQEVKIELGDDGFDPALIIIERYVETEWVIDNNSALGSEFVMNIPKYNQTLVLKDGENYLYMFPIEDFDFSNGYSTFFGYVKVVDNISEVDIDDVKDEVNDFKTFIWDSELTPEDDALDCH